MRVPGFLARQILVPGSFRATADGFTIAARNPFGDGWLTGIGRIAVDGRPVDPAAVTATRSGDAAVYRADGVTPQTPVAFRKGDEVIFIVRGPVPGPGEHTLEVEIAERNLGLLVVEVREPLVPPA
ncbi:MAG: hypothetical protein ACKOTZ_02225 [Chloroflexota bacterium]